MDWVFDGAPLEAIPEKAVGFVYLISNTLSGKSYIGKKRFFFSKSKQVKKKKKKFKVESDWRTYYGSSDEIATDVATLGAENFTRTILRICYSLGECSYYEAKLQFQHEVLEHPDKWYNAWISVRVRRNHVTWLSRL
jgi:hypothetical protein